MKMMSFVNPVWKAKECSKLSLDRLLLSESITIFDDDDVIGGSEEFHANATIVDDVIFPGEVDLSRIQERLKKNLKI